MLPYEPEIEQSMKNYFETLSEKDRRRYAGVEALKLGRGGITYLVIPDFVVEGIGPVERRR